MRILKKSLSVFLCLIMITSVFVGVGIFEAFAGTEASGKRDLEYGITYWYSDVGVSGYTSGTGTKTDPYIITTAAQLRHLARGDVNSAGKYYKLGNDIVLNDTSAESWYEGTNLTNWIKGTDSTYGVFSDTRNYRELGGDLFRGNFDGAGYTISGLYINYEGTGKMSGSVSTRIYCGWALFPYVYGATFENVKIKDVYIKSNITASVTTDYHGYGALVGNVHGEQPTTFTNVQVENVQFDITRPNLASAGKPVGIGGVIGYSYGNLTVTDAIVKNVTANIKNWYGTSRNAAYVGGIFGAMGWAKKATLTNVLTIGKMNPISASSANSGGAVSVQSGNWIGDIKANQSINVSATNCYSVGAEKIPSGVAITNVVDETAFVRDNLNDFYSNIGSSTNWANKVEGELPQLSDYYVDNSMPSDKRDLEYDGTYWYSNKKVSSYTFGKGTKDDPYIITNAAQLRHLARGSADSAGKYYKLGNDIVINDTTDEYWYEETDLKNWIMGSDDTYGVYSDTRNYREMGGDLFRGHFDGAGHTISGLYINYNGTGKMTGFNNSRIYCGWALFPLVYGATFENVKLKDVYIKSNVTGNTADYHGYGALVGNVHGEQSTTFTNVQVENVQFDLARPNLTVTSKPVGIGGIIGYSYGNLSVTDAVVKNVTANIKNYYAHSRCLAYVGGIVGITGWAKTVTLNNVITIGNMNPLSTTSATSGGAVSIQSGNWIGDMKSNMATNVVATNCYSIGAERILPDAAITRVSDVLEFIDEQIDPFYDNIGTSTNWSPKTTALPQLKAFTADTIMVQLPTSEIVDIKFKIGDKLEDIEVKVDGFSDDGKWYEDYDSTALSTDEYPVIGKVYYRKWSKYLLLDLEKKYLVANGDQVYTDPHDSSLPYSKYHTRSDVTRRILRDTNYVIELTYANDNPAYREAGLNYGSGGEYFHNYKNSPCIWIFDTGTNETFTGSPGFKYKISFDYEIEGPIPEEDVSFYLYLTKDIVTSHDAVVNGLNNENNILVGKFDVDVADGSKGNTGDLEFTGRMGYKPRIVMVTNDGTRVDESPEVYHRAYIDNIEVTEEIPEGETAVSISFNSDGGSAATGFRVLKNNPIGKLPTPTRAGYLFDCWYLEGDEDKKEINNFYEVKRSLKLVAKWVAVTKSNYDSEGFEEFDTLRYPNVLNSYDDLDMSKLSSTGTVDSTMTAANRYIEENCPAGMGAALLVSNSPAVMSNGLGLPATVLLEKDGSKFTVQSGVTYKIEFDYLPLGESNAHSYIGIKYGSYALDSLNGSSATGTEKIAVHGLRSDKTTVTQYFKPTNSGFVYFTLGARQNFDNANAQHFVLIDNVKITIADEAKSITFVDADTNKVVDSRPVGFGYHVQYGMPGDKIREFAINTKSGKQIEGFYNDLACTTPCTDYDVISDTNKIVYVKMKDADYSQLSDFTNPITLDFESSNELNLETFYRYMPYMSWTSTELDNIVDYVGNDSKEAFSGSGYVRIKDYEFAYGEKGHSFVLYDKNNPSGLMILSPNTTYRISAKAKYEDDAKIPSLKIWSVNLTDFSYRRYGSTLTTKNEDMMGYDEISGIITTSDEPVAVAIGGIYLAEQNVYVDDIKVEKLLERTIKFETNGGDPIDDIKVLPYSDLSSYDPGFAFRPGYDFMGWYLDEELTKPFDFLVDYVIEDITLYAKFVEEEEYEEEPEEDYESDDDFTDNVVDDPTDNPTDGSNDNIVDNPTDGSNDNTVDNPTDGSNDNNVDNSTDNSTDGSNDNAVDNSTDDSNDNTVDNSTDDSNDNTVDNSTDNSNDNTVDNSTDSSNDNIVDNSTDSSNDNIVDNSTDNSTDSSNDNIVDDSTNNSTDASDDVVDNTTENLTDDSTDNLLDNSADNITDNLTDDLIDNSYNDLIIENEGNIEQDNFGFGDKVSLDNNYLIEKSDGVERVVEEQQPRNIWLIVIIGVSGVLVLGGAVVFVIWFLRRKKQ